MPQETLEQRLARLDREAQQSLDSRLDALDNDPFSDVEDRSSSTASPFRDVRSRSSSTADPFDDVTAGASTDPFSDVTAGSSSSVRRGRVEVGPVESVRGPRGRTVVPRETMSDLATMRGGLAPAIQARLELARDPDGFEDLRPEINRKASESAIANTMLGDALEEFTKGLAGGVGMTTSALGEQMDAGLIPGGESVRGYGEGLTKRARARVEKVENIKGPRDAVDWAAWNLGQGIGTMAPIVAGAAAGAASGNPYGAALGAALPAFILGAGEIRGDMRREGVEGAELDAIAQPFGGVAGALDAVVPGDVVKRLFSKTAVGAVAKARGRRVAGATLKGGLGESATETAQTAISQAGRSLGTGENHFDGSELWNSAAAGGLTGAAVSGASAVRTPEQEQRPFRPVERAQQVPPVPPAPSGTAPEPEPTPSGTVNLNSDPANSETGVDQLYGIRSGEDRYIIDEPATGEESLELRVLARAGDVRLATPDGTLSSNVEPMLRAGWPIEKVIAHMFGDRPQGAEPDVSKVRRAAPKKVDPKDVAGDLSIEKAGTSYELRIRGGKIASFPTKTSARKAMAAIADMPELAGEEIDRAAFERIQAAIAEANGGRNLKYRNDSDRDLAERAVDLQKRIEEYSSGEHGSPMWVRYDDDQAAVVSGGTGVERRIRQDTELRDEVLEEFKKRTGYDDPELYLEEQIERESASSEATDADDSFDFGANREIPGLDEDDAPQPTQRDNVGPGDEWYQQLERLLGEGEQLPTIKLRDDSPYNDDDAEGLHHVLAAESAREAEQYLRDTLVAQLALKVGKHPSTNRKLTPKQREQLERAAAVDYDGYERTISTLNSQFEGRLGDWLRQRLEKHYSSKAAQPDADAWADEPKKQSAAKGQSEYDKHRAAATDAWQGRKLMHGDKVVDIHGRVWEAEQEGESDSWVLRGESEPGIKSTIHFGSGFDYANYKPLGPRAQAKVEGVPDRKQIAAPKEVTPPTPIDEYIAARRRYDSMVANGDKAHFRVLNDELVPLAKAAGFDGPVTVAKAEHVRDVPKPRANRPAYTFFSGKDSEKVRAAAQRRGDIGLVVTPMVPHFVRHMQHYPAVMVDNGAFGKAGFTAEKFTKLLDTIESTEGAKEKVEFVVAPDVPMDAAGTLELFKEWGPKISARGFRVAFAAQNGVEQSLESIPWDSFDVLFIGGDTNWKTGTTDGKNVSQKFINMIKEAERRGKDVHMGRVNSAKRSDVAAYGLGARSADGNFLGYGEDANMPRLEKWLDAENKPRSTEGLAPPAQRKDTRPKLPYQYLNEFVEMTDEQLAKRKAELEPQREADRKAHPDGYGDITIELRELDGVMQERAEIAAIASSTIPRWKKGQRPKSVDEVVLYLLTRSDSWVTARFAKLHDNGGTDAQIAEALGQAWGSMQGEWSDNGKLDMRGGNSPRLEIERFGGKDAGDLAKPIKLSGKQLLATVRRVLEIPQPGKAPTLDARLDAIEKESDSPKQNAATWYDANGRRREFDDEGLIPSTAAMYRAAGQSQLRDEYADVSALLENELHKVGDGRTTTPIMKKIQNRLEKLAREFKARGVSVHDYRSHAVMRAEGVKKATLERPPLLPDDVAGVRWKILELNEIADGKQKDGDMRGAVLIDQLKRLHGLTDEAIAEAQAELALGNELPRRVSEDSPTYGATPRVDYARKEGETLAAWNARIKREKKQLAAYLREHYADMKQPRAFERWYTAGGNDWVNYWTLTPSTQIKGQYQLTLFIEHDGEVMPQSHNNAQSLEDAFEFLANENVTPSTRVFEDSPTYDRREGERGKAPGHRVAIAIFDDSGFLETRTRDELNEQDNHHSLTLSADALEREEQGALAYRVGDTDDVVVVVGPYASMPGSMIRQQLKAAGFRASKVIVIRKTDHPKADDIVTELPLPRSLREDSPAYEGERIKSAAVRTSDGRIFEGTIHVMAVEAAEAAGAVEEGLAGRVWIGASDVDGYESAGLEDGFTTSTGRFVGREEAYEISERAEQLNSLGQSEAYDLEQFDITPTLDSVHIKGNEHAVSRWISSPLRRDDRVYEEPRERSPKQLELDLTKDAIIAHGSIAKQREADDALIKLAGKYLNLPTVDERSRAVAPSKKKRPWVDIRGKTMENAHDAYQLLAPFRDPRMEKMHAIILDNDGRVVSHELVTSGAVNAVQFNDQWIQQIAARAKRLGARRVLLAHNHPSGNPKPSYDDIRVTALIGSRFQEHGIRLDGQVVINHNKGSMIAPIDRHAVGFGTEHKKLTLGIPLPSSSEEIPGIGAVGFDVATSRADDSKYDWTDSIGPTVAGPVDAMLMLAAADKKGAQLIYLSSQHQVIALETRTLGSLKSIEKWLPAKVKALGGVKVVLGGRKSAELDQLVANIVESRRLGDDAAPLDSILDVMEIGATAAASFSHAERGPWLNPSRVDKDLPLRRLREPDASWTANQKAALLKKLASAPPTERGKIIAQIKELAKAPVDHTQKIDAGEMSKRAAQGETRDAVESITGEKPLETSRDERQSDIFGAAPPAPRASRKQKDDDGDQQGALFAPAALRRRLAAIGVPVPPSDEVEALINITRNLAKALNTPVRQGRFKANARRALGVFFTKSESIRVRRYDHIDTVAHEIGHYISKKYLGNPTRKKTVSPTPKVTLPKSAVAELVQMGKNLYGSRKPAGGYGEEGIAEYFSFYVTEPARLSAEAPTFHAWMQANVYPNETVLKNAIDQARDDFLAHKGGTPEQRFDALISVNERVRFRPSWRWLKANSLDDLAEIELAVSELGGETDPAKNAYTLARLTRGDAGAADEMIERGMTRLGSTKRLTRGIAEILRDVPRKKIQDFRRYLVAERVLELSARGIDSGFTSADAQAIVDAADPSFRKLAEELWQISNLLIDYRVDAGLLTADEARAIKKKNERRVGFYRVFTEEEKASGSAGAGKGYGRNSSGVHKIKGSAREVIDPLESIITDVYRTVQHARHHQVFHELVEHAESTDGGARVVEVLTEKPQHRETVPMEDAVRQLADLGFDVTEIDTKTGEPVSIVGEEGHFDAGEVAYAFRYNTQPGPRETKDLVIPYIANGRRHWIQIKDGRLFDALKRLDTETLNPWMRFASKPAKLVRAGATLTLEFIGRNPIRDAWTSAIYSKAGMRPPGWNLAKGLFELARGGELYQAWKLEGGDNAAMLGVDRKQVQKNLEQLLRTPGEQLRDVVVRPIDTLRMVSAAMENGTRIGEFMAVRKKLLAEGMTEDQANKGASLASRDVSIDFARAGIVGRQLNQIVAFFNATVQGNEKLVREHSTLEGAARVSLRAGAFITLPSILLYLLQKDDETYKEIPRWQKDLFWIWVDRDENGDVEHIWRFPKPFELGIIYGTVPERIVEYIVSKNPRAFDNLVKSVWEGFTPPVWPSGLAPLIENWANKSWFRDRPIIPRGLERFPESKQATRYSSETARLLGEVFDYPPAKIDNLIQGYTAGLGRQYAVPALDAGIRGVRRAAGKEPLSPPSAQAPKLAQRIPGVRGFTIREPGTSAESVEQLYRTYEKAERHRQYWHELEKQGRKDEAREYYEQHKELIDGVVATSDARKRGHLREAYNAVSALRDTAYKVEHSLREPDRKQSELKRINKKLIETAERAIAARARPAELKARR